MRQTLAKRTALTILAVLLLPALGAAPLKAQDPDQRPTSSRPPETVSRPAPFPAAALACQKRVGILGGYFQAEMQAFLVANGLGVSIETAATIAGGSLNNVDVLYVNRSGSADATAQAATIEAWVRGGGTLITEFDATTLLFDGATFGFFPAATLDLPFAVPSGTVCGGNTVSITSPSNALAAGLPAVWTCSGDPIGVFKVYQEGTLPLSLDRVARISVDQNGDGADDPVVGTACVDNGVLVPFFTDFGDWQPLQNPRTCPNPPCNRSIEDEALMLNAVCRAIENCGEGDHFLCYRIQPNSDFRPRDVLIRNQFGEQNFLVISPELLCVPSTKKVLRVH